VQWWQERNRGKQFVQCYTPLILLQSLSNLIRIVFMKTKEVSHIIIINDKFVKCYRSINGLLEQTSALKICSHIHQLELFQRQ
jgi:hypothetical protein